MLDQCGHPITEQMLLASWRFKANSWLRLTRGLSTARMSPAMRARIPPIPAGYIPEPN